MPGRPAPPGQGAQRRVHATEAGALHGSLQGTLDAVTAGPAFVRNGRMDLPAANALARAFYADAYAFASESPGGRPANLARFQFLAPAARRFYPDWDLAADICVAILRTEAGRNPRDKDLHDLVGELSTRSDAFRTRWGAHNVRHHGTGTKRFHHAVVGELTLAYEGLDMAAEPGLTLTVYTWHGRTFSPAWGSRDKRSMLPVAPELVAEIAVDSAFATGLPRLLGEIAYATRTRAGLLRHPAWHRLRPDPAPEDATSEWVRRAGAANQKGAMPVPVMWACRSRTRSTVKEAARWSTRRRRVVAEAMRFMSTVGSSVHTRPPQVPPVSRRRWASTGMLAPSAATIAGPSYRSCVWKAPLMSRVR